MSPFALIAVAAALLQPALQEAPATALPHVTATAPVGAPPEAEPDPLDRVTCRTEPVVGSRFNSRVCMTRREWNQRREESQRLTRRLEVQNSNRDRITAPSQGG